jgi:hypothetical protein
MTPDAIATAEAAFETLAEDPPALAVRFFGPVAFQPAPLPALTPLRRRPREDELEARLDHVLRRVAKARTARGRTSALRGRTVDPDTVARAMRCAIGHLLADDELSAVLDRWCRDYEAGTAAHRAS